MEWWTSTYENSLSTKRVVVNIGPNSSWTYVDNAWDVTRWKGNVGNVYLETLWGDSGKLLGDWKSNCTYERKPMGKAWYMSTAKKKQLEKRWYMWKFRSAVMETRSCPCGNCEGTLFDCYDWWGPTCDETFKDSTLYNVNYCSIQDHHEEMCSCRRSAEKLRHRWFWKIDSEWRLAQYWKRIWTAKKHYSTEVFLKCFENR